MICFVGKTHISATNWIFYLGFGTCMNCNHSIIKVYTGLFWGSPVNFMTAYWYFKTKGQRGFPINFTTQIIMYEEHIYFFAHINTNYNRLIKNRCMIVFYSAFDMASRQLLPESINFRFQVKDLLLHWEWKSFAILMLHARPHLLKYLRKTGK